MSGPLCHNVAVRMVWECAQAVRIPICSVAGVDDEPRVMVAAYEGADSMVLLSQVMQRVRNEGFELLDCDCTVAAQAPKLLPHRDAMRNRMAGIGSKAIEEHRQGLEARNL